MKQIPIVMLFKIRDGQRLLYFKKNGGGYAHTVTTQCGHSSCNIDNLNAILVTNDEAKTDTDTDI